MFRGYAEGGWVDVQGQLTFSCSYSHQRFTPRAGAAGHLVAQGRFSPLLPMGA